MMSFLPSAACFEWMASLSIFIGWFKGGREAMISFSSLDLKLGFDTVSAVKALPIL
jgi:hypothetical protein